MRLNEAIKQLRGKESQQLFATRMGISIAALQNYERETNPRRPRAYLLARLIDEAQAAGKHELATVFLDALESDLGCTIQELEKMATTARAWA